MSPTTAHESVKRSQKKPVRGKRKRSQLESQPGIALPNIPGVPLELIPLHIQALNTTDRLFQRHDAETVIPPFQRTLGGLINDDKSLIVTPTPPSDKRRSGTVMDVLMNRIDQTMERTEAQSEKARNLRDLQSRSDSAVESWLLSIRQWLRHSKSSRTSGNGTSSSTTQREIDSTSVSVPVAILKHLIHTIISVETQIIHAKRRASTHLMGILMSKSADCRQWLFDNSTQTLLSWMDTVVTAKISPLDDPRNTRDNKDGKHARLWQIESFLLLQHLNVQFGNLYPTLGVSIQRFQQLCPNVVTFSNESPSVTLPRHNSHNGSQYRKLRDDAMIQAERIERRVHKLLVQANYCIDFLVPRMTGTVATSSTYPTVKATNHFESKSSEHVEAIHAHAHAAVVGNDDDDDDDDAVDWEDGLEKIIRPMSQASHALAVERTLTVMKHTTGVLDGGELEIDFAKPDTSYSEKQKISLTESVVSIRERLHNVAGVLNQRYMARLTSWLDALSQADSLVEVTNEQKSAAAGEKVTSSNALAFVSMSQCDIERRRNVFHLIQSLKRDVASILSSTRRLGLSPNADSEMNSDINESHKEPRIRVVSSAQAQQKKPRLQATIFQHRVVKKATDIPHKRNRIQIKYRKD